MGITIRTTYGLVTPQSLEMGDYAEQGFIDEEGTEYTFAELVELLERCDFVGDSSAGISDYHTDHTTGAVESREYFPVSERDKRYFDKAVLFSGFTFRKPTASIKLNSR